MPKRKTNVIISAQLIVIRNQGEPDVAYWTAEGASIRLHELKRKRGAPTLSAVGWLTKTGKVVPDGYLNNLIPLYSDETIQKLAKLPYHWRAEAEPSAPDPQTLTAVPVLDEGDAADTP